MSFEIGTFETRLSVVVGSAYRYSRRAYLRSTTSSIRAARVRARSHVKLSADRVLSDASMMWFMAMLPLTAAASRPTFSNNTHLRLEISDDLLFGFWDFITVVSLTVKTERTCQRLIFSVGGGVIERSSPDL